jgi:hypothetical protein
MRWSKRRRVLQQQQALQFSFHLSPLMELRVNLVQPGRIHLLNPRASILEFA